MGVVSAREILPRTFSHKFGESPTAERRFAVTVDNSATPHADVIDAVGVFHGDEHPEHTYLRMLDAQLQENSPDPYHVELTLRYEVPSQEDLDPNPLARPDVWSFSTGGAQVPALVYYHGAGNNNKKPLQNTAKDFFEGLTTLEAELRASISGNRADFPLADATVVTNSVNSATYLGGAKHSWLCAGISGQQATEVVNDTEIRYWQITVELVYRRSGHNLLLPNVGWNYLDNGEKKRAWVLDPEANPPEKVASGAPVALDANGNIKAAGQEPDILERRVYPEADFSSYFGTPPF